MLLELATAVIYQPRAGLNNEWCGGADARSASKGSDPRRERERETTQEEEEGGGGIEIRENTTTPRNWELMAWEQDRRGRWVGHMMANPLKWAETHTTVSEGRPSRYNPWLVVTPYPPIIQQ